MIEKKTAYCGMQTYLIPFLIAWEGLLHFFGSFLHLFKSGFFSRYHPESETPRTLQDEPALDIMSATRSMFIITPIPPTLNNKQSVILAACYPRLCITSIIKKLLVFPQNNALCKL